MATYLNKNLIDGVEGLPRLTQAEFDLLPLAQKPSLWIKRNATETDRGITAEDVEYDNSASELQATDVQAAIDELEENIEEIPTDAEHLPYSSTQSTKQKIDEVDAKKIRTFTYPLAIEKQCNANTTWTTFSFNVSKGDIYTISGASTATSGAFTRNITGSVSGTIVNDAINHANVNNAKMWGFFEAQNDEVITFTSYTNTATTFKGVGITITQET